MNDDLREEFRARALLSSHAAASALVAAESATVEGRLNLAKVLQAAALNSRATALRLERIASGSESSPAMFAEVNAFQANVTQWLRTLVNESSLDAAERASLLTVSGASQSARDILSRSAAVLVANRDVPESVVGQFLFGCEECGYIAEASRPEICPACGSIAGEWQMFAPFYSSTPEHISRHKPDVIVEMLSGDTTKLRAALAGCSDADLRRSPAPGEWCAKEIAGHMIDIAELFNRRLLALLDPDANVAPEATLLPWKIIDGQDYPDATADALISRFDAAITQALALISRLETADWRKKADMLSGRVPVIDMGSWLANHNVAHLAQIRDRLALDGSA